MGPPQQQVYGSAMGLYQPQHMGSGMGQQLFGSIMGARQQFVGSAIGPQQQIFGNISSRHYRGLAGDPFSGRYWGLDSLIPNRGWVLNSCSKVLSSSSLQ